MITNDVSTCPKCGGDLKYYSPMLWPIAILTTMMAKRRRTTATSNILTNPKEEIRL